MISNKRSRAPWITVVLDYLAEQTDADGYKWCDVGNTLAIGARLVPIAKAVHFMQTRTYHYNESDPDFVNQVARAQRSYVRHTLRRSKYVEFNADITKMRYREVRGERHS